MKTVQVTLFFTPEEFEDLKGLRRFLAGILKKRRSTGLSDGSWNLLLRIVDAMDGFPF